jgi:acyl-CoA synthetase (NDP forming)
MPEPRHHDDGFSPVPTDGRANVRSASASSLSDLTRFSLFGQPGSVAVIGASEKPDSLGSHVIANLQAGAYADPVLPVNPRYRSIHRILGYKTVEDMPIVPDLAILCTPAGPTPDIVARLGARGTGAAIVVTEDLDSSDRPTARST